MRRDKKGTFRVTLNQVPGDTDKQLGPVLSPGATRKNRTRAGVRSHTTKRRAGAATFEVREESKSTSTPTTETIRENKRLGGVRSHAARRRTAAAKFEGRLKETELILCNWRPGDSTRGFLPEVKAFLALLATALSQLTLGTAGVDAADAVLKFHLDALEYKTAIPSFPLCRHKICELFQYAYSRYKEKKDIFQTLFYCKLRKWPYYLVYYINFG